MKQPAAFAILLAGLTLAGCGESNLGSPDNPAKFTQETIDEYAFRIAEVQEDASLSPEQKQEMIAQLEKERSDFEAYNVADGPDGLFAGEQ